MIQNGLDKLSSVKVFIDDSPSLGVLQMRSMARRLQMEHGLDLLIVDYLQLIRPRTSSDNMVQQVTEISRGLKALARELKVPVLAVSQLSRGVEQRGGMPRLSDLRESGSIEQDADVVMFLYRKDRDSNATYGQDEEGTTQVIVAKHRNGALGTVDLKFDAERATFKTSISATPRPMPCRRCKSIASLSSSRRRRIRASKKIIKHGLSACADNDLKLD